MIDVDEMDYFARDALTAASPAVIVLAFNAIFGTERRLACRTPRVRDVDGALSGRYYGASPHALESLTATSAYSLVGITNKWSALLRSH